MNQPNFVLVLNVVLAGVGVFAVVCCCLFYGWCGRIGRGVIAGRDSDVQCRDEEAGNNVENIDS